MIDSTGSGAGVASGVGIKNPIRLAHEVANHLRPVKLLVGKAASALAQVFGLSERDARTPRSVAKYQELMQAHPELRKLLLEEEPYSTVGAVVRDVNGILAAATSTGGQWLKHPGRVGDTPIISSGLWADPQHAVVCTGDGDRLFPYSPALRLSLDLSPDSVLSSSPGPFGFLLLGQNSLTVGHNGGHLQFAFLRNSAPTSVSLHQSNASHYSLKTISD